MTRCIDESRHSRTVSRLSCNTPLRRRGRSHRGGLDLVLQHRKRGIAIAGLAISVHVLANERHQLLRSLRKVQALQEALPCMQPGRPVDLAEIAVRIVKVSTHRIAVRHRILDTDVMCGEYSVVCQDVLQRVAAERYL